jgi:prevent-host-death family protein
MRAREAVTQTMAASDAKRNWSKVINRAFSGEARFVVQKHGIPVAGIVSADDVERLAALDAQREQDFEILETFGRAFRDQTAEQIEAAVAQAVAEVRAENRQRAECRPAPE